MKHILLFAFILFTSLLWSQNVETYEKSPVFPECESQPIENLKTCFNNKLNQYIYNNFKMPQKVTDESYKGDVQILLKLMMKAKLMCYM